MAFDPDSANVRANKFPSPRAAPVTTQTCSQCTAESARGARERRGVRESDEAVRESDEKWSGGNGGILNRSIDKRSGAAYLAGHREGSERTTNVATDLRRGKNSENQ